MKTYTARELRQAVLLAVVLTALITIALLDPTCRQPTDVPHTAPSRSLAPR